MTYTVENFCADARAAIKSDPGPDGREKVRQCLERLLKEKDFIEKECNSDMNAGVRTIYRDPETDFNLLVHAYAQTRTSPPHDHGRSWAIYGQAVKWTEMTVWKRKDDGSKEGYADLEAETTYRLEPGMAAKFDPGVIHSIHFPEGAQFVRVTGTDLDTIPQKRFDLSAKKVVVGRPM